MARPPRTSGSTLSLRRARAVLRLWHDRLEAARNRAASLDATARAAMLPLLDELQERFDGATADILRLQRLERSWRDAHVAVNRSMHFLEQTWARVGSLLPATERTR